LRKAGVDVSRDAIASALREWMAETRTSQWDLSAIVLCPQSRISDVCSGKHPLPTEWLYLVKKASPRHGRDLESRVSFAIETLLRLTA
jgi:predicted transcriptional regulator